jgi:hypothetical protein
MLDKAKTKWQFEVSVYEKDDSGTTRLYLGISIIDPENSSHFAYDWDLTAKQRALQHIKLRAFVYDGETPRLIGFDEVNYDGYEPGVAELVAAIPVMRSLNTAIQRRHRPEGEEDSLVWCILAVAKHVKANRLRYFTIADRTWHEMPIEAVRKVVGAKLEAFVKAHGRRRA